MDKDNSRVDTDDPSGKTDCNAQASPDPSSGGAQLPCGHKPGGRNLIVCIDATANRMGLRNTNVIEMYRMILKKISDRQPAWYNSGIGTYAQSHRNSLSYYKEAVSHWMDMAIAWNFENTVKDAYRWLSDNYEEGDCIFLFGFARGAFQVRVLAAMIAKVGLIHKGNEAQIPFAYEVYADPATADGGSGPLVDAAGSTIEGPKEMVSKAAQFKAKFCQDVNVHFVGAWETISSIGFMRGKKTLPGITDGMKQTCYFRHALALDERRVKFQPEYAYGGSAMPPPGTDAKNCFLPTHETQSSDGTTIVPSSLNDSKPRTLEVWFAGTHSDIGGGNAYDAEMNRSRPPLKWMVQEAESLGLRIEEFDRNIKLDEQVNSVDSLKGIWRVLEIFPIQRLTFSRRPEVRGRTTYKPHLGSGRKVHEGQKIHGSLILGKATYTPKASLPKGSTPHYPHSWGKLLENGVSKRLGILETNLYDHTRTRLERYTVAEPGDQDFFEQISGRGSGAQVLYDEIIEVIEGWPAEENPNLEEQRQLLDTASRLLGHKASTLTLPDGYELRHRLSHLSESNDEGMVNAATTFFRQLTSPCISKLEGHTRFVRSVAISPDGTRIASGSNDRSIQIWDAQTGDVLHKLEGHTNWVRSVAFSPDGKYIVSGSDDHSIRVWDAQTGDMVRELKGHTSWVRSVAFSSDGKRIVSGSDDYSVRIWDSRTGDMLRKLEGHGHRVNSVAFSPDGKHIVSGSSDWSIRIWNARTGRAMKKLEGRANWVNSVAFSSDGTRIVSGLSDCSIQIWDAGTGRLVTTLEGHTRAVKSVAFSSDQTRIVSGSNDHSIRIWDAGTGDMLRKLEGHAHRVNSVAFSSDKGRETRIVSGSSDGSVRVWDVQGFL